MRYVFGPVPSRRLGMSLGVDMVPYKTCTFDCVYCECGRTTAHEVTRRQHFDSLSPVLDEVKRALKRGRRLDYITLGGSGEPTLNLQCGELIREIKRITDVKVAVLTNGSLLTEREVFQDLLHADLVVPSLDAARQSPFEKVNRPVAGLSIESVAEAMSEFVGAFDGDVWLEVLLVEGLNDSEQDLSALLEAVRRIDPLLVQMGTVERPGTEDWARPVDDKVLAGFVARLGTRATVIGRPVRHFGATSESDMSSDILALVFRRPCTIEDIESGVGGKRPIILGKVRELEEAGKITEYIHKGERFYIGERS